MPIYNASLHAIGDSKFEATLKTQGYLHVAELYRELANKRKEVVGNEYTHRDGRKLIHLNSGSRTANANIEAHFTINEKLDRINFLKQRPDVKIEKTQQPL